MDMCNKWIKGCADGSADLVMSCAVCLSSNRIECRIINITRHDDHVQTNKRCIFMFTQVEEMLMLNGCCVISVFGVIECHVDVMSCCMMSCHIDRAHRWDQGRDDDVADDGTVPIAVDEGGLFIYDEQMIHHASATYIV